MGKYYRIMAGVLATLIAFTGCASKKGNEVPTSPTEPTVVVGGYEVPTSPTEPTVFVGEEDDNTIGRDELQDILRTTSISDVIDSLGEYSFLDDYLKSSDYESLVSDYVGFRDCGDIEAARNVLLELGKYILRGSVLDVLYREDSEFAERIGVDFDEEDIDISYGWHADCVRGVDVIINGGDKYKEFVKNGEFGVGYSVGGYGIDFIDLLDDLDNGKIDDLNGLQDAFNSMKKFIVMSGNYAEDTDSVMDGLNYLNGFVNSGEIEYTTNSDAVAVLKKR